MNLKQDRIEEIVRISSDFADVLIKHLKTIKNSPYAGLMIFVFYSNPFAVAAIMSVSFVELLHYLRSQ
jgi:hypothetical protein